MKFTSTMSSFCCKPSSSALLFNFIHVNYGLWCRSMAHVSNKRITRIQSDVEVNETELKQDGNEKYVQLRLKNRNPRNLEQMLLEPKPTGFEMDQQNPHHWNQLVFEKKSKFLVGKIVHQSGRTVCQASTNEPSLAIFLGHSRSDMFAAKILGQVLAMRSLECGVHSIYCDQRQFDPKSSGEKVLSFIDALRTNGLHLDEQPNIVARAPRDH